MYVTFLFLNKFALQEAERIVEGSLKYISDRVHSCMKQSVSVT